MRQQFTLNELIGKMCGTHQLVFVYGHMVGSTYWEKSSGLRLINMYPAGAFAATAMWTEFEEHIGRQENIQGKSEIHSSSEWIEEMFRM